MTAKANLKKILPWALGGMGLILVILGYFAYQAFLNVPDFKILRQSFPMAIRKANGDDGVRTFGPRASGWISVKQAPSYLLAAVISSEDTTFLQHKGVDLHELKEAIKEDIEKGRFARGASTITQQVIKNVFLSSEKSLWRKIREVIWAGKMEAVLSKSEILETYINIVELGPGIYGVSQAAPYYFGVSAEELSPRQAAYFAMLLPSPRRYHDANFPKRRLTPWARKQVENILFRMNQFGYLSEREYQESLRYGLWGRQLIGEEGDSASPQNSPEVSPTTQSMEVNIPTPSPSSESSPSPSFDGSKEEDL